MYNFASAAPYETYVHGAERSGYSAQLVEKASIDEWIHFMRQNGIQRVCCLLDNDQLDYYTDNLIEIYRQAFGTHNVCHAPIPDYSLCPTELLNGTILPFLSHSTTLHKKVVVHCSGGIGRTGHVLAAWLVHQNGVNPKEAIEIVRETRLAHRNPSEAVDTGTATFEELYALLQSCRSKP
jgi:protein-tyrosine phosphatase